MLDAIKTISCVSSCFFFVYLENYSRYEKKSRDFFLQRIEFSSKKVSYEIKPILYRYTRIKQKNISFILYTKYNNYTIIMYPSIQILRNIKIPLNSLKYTNVNFATSFIKLIQLAIYLPNKYPTMSSAFINCDIIV